MNKEKPMRKAVGPGDLLAVPGAEKKEGLRSA